MCWLTMVCLLAFTPASELGAASDASLRPPSVPLVACDPYFSIWSPSDKLNGSDTVHWTGKPHRLTGLLKVDKKTYRVMGKEPADVPALEQTKVEVLPTRTIYTFEGAGVRLGLIFMTAALPEDLMIYSRPVTYLTWEVQAIDGKKHQVEGYFSAGSEIAVNQPSQAVQYTAPNIAGLTTLAVGTADQPVLQKKGDDLRIDWGHLLIAMPVKSAISANALDTEKDRATFLEKPRLGREVRQGSTPVNQGAPALSFSFGFGSVGSKNVSRFLLLAYDDEYSIQYFKKNLRPYWRRNGDDTSALLKKALSEYESLSKRCEKFDKELMAALTKAGGEKYARLCALAYRQCVAANKVVADDNGQPLMFPKENFSNGCIGTVDVIYPMAPQFLLFSPSLTKAMLVPIMDYAMSPRWRWPFAPHDLGTYPWANGQVYGGGERTERDQMPVEETGNMLVLLAALAQVEGNADFCEKYWPVLDKWAAYLQDKGFDPENQLCTDDFAGHLAHNVNLSAKAICGLGAYAKLCEMRGAVDKAASVKKVAKEFAERWVKEAMSNGDHSPLAFDKPGTWSQKYNLVWDRILNLQLFPSEVLRKELDYYKTKQNEFGLPLDSRKDYTKLDWTLWTATLTRDRNDFESLLSPVYHFLSHTPSRVPLTDWYDTKTAKMSGFQARSVVGGVFLEMLYDQQGWKSWAGRDRTRAAKWAALPKAPEAVVVVPTSQDQPVEWQYTTESQSNGWFKTDFDAASWKRGPAGFGTHGTPGSVVRTEWRSPDIWLRREVTIPEGAWQDLHLMLHHDEDAEIYIDGIPAAQVSGYVVEYEPVSVRSQARKLLTPGKHTIAVHCHQTGGGQYIDVGLVDVRAH